MGGGRRGWGGVWGGDEGPKRRVEGVWGRRVSVLSVFPFLYVGRTIIIRVSSRNQSARHRCVISENQTKPMFRLMLSRVLDERGGRTERLDTLGLRSRA